jgi:alkanesulfonate monooxygenase SsuD/methylene tetrahydromethanopterin reductase-like flavin-dependent oxidoreductase (luciferase family)
MKIGIGLPTQIRDLDAALIPGWASRAEEAGFSTLATLGRIAYPGVMDTVALAGAAAATQRIGLSSNVMLSTVWPAPLLAKELAGIDAMSGGRLTLGLGIGGDRPDDFVAEGLPPRRLGRRMDSDLETFHRLWRGEPVGGGVNPAVPSATRQIPLLFGGMAPASFARMAKWGQGYVGGALPAPVIEPMFAAARQAWCDAGRDGSPRLVAVAYFVFGDAERGRSSVRDYYEAIGDEFADAEAQSVHVGADGARTAVESFEAIGADELILHPTIADIDEVGKLADAVLR